MWCVVLWRGVLCEKVWCSVVSSMLTVPFVHLLGAVAVVARIQEERCPSDVSGYYVKCVYVIRHLQIDTIQVPQEESLVQ
jgi:hypothetical protein